VGTRGQILAVDVRKMSLFFLLLKARLDGHANIHVIVGEEANPHLPMEAADAVLICNTYHEFSQPRAMLMHSFRALRSGGRLVIAERGRTEDGHAPHSHDIDLAQVMTEVQQAGFCVIRQDPHLFTDPEGDPWWLLAATKPQNICTSK
jgi:ubiquinone/menaquinone biosynthesis C-methylase UbiE